MMVYDRRQVEDKKKRFEELDKPEGVWHSVMEVKNQEARKLSAEEKIKKKY